jgi:hypothetical protein
MKRPSFQFYPSDWLRDTALRSCSAGARGLWIDMICFMHEGSPYGYLKVGDKVILADNLHRMVGETLEVVEGWLHELELAGVFNVDNGIICSRRMIRDEQLRQKRAEGGKLGGNPNLIGKSKVNLKVEQEVKQIPTPSSSSSSSFSIKDISQGKPAKPKRKTSISDDFSVSQRVKDWAKQKGFDKLDEHLDAFTRKAKMNGYQYLDWDLAFMEAIREDWAKIRGKQSFAQQAADIARTTVPAQHTGRDPVLLKIDADRQNAAPMPEHIRKQINQVLRKA